MTGICLRSASVRPGDLYAALPGSRTHGANFSAEARVAGATAILTDPAGSPAAARPGCRPWSSTAPRAVLGAVAAAVYASPADAFTLIGVTGTQGKTTTTQLLAHALAAAGRRTAVIGTMGTWVDGEPVKTPLDDPGGAGPARDVRRHARARGRGLRDGGLEPRPGARPGRRRRLRPRGLPQLRQGPPRLPPGRRALLRGEGQPVHSRSGARRALLNADDPSRGGAGRAAAHPGADLLAPRAAPRTGGARTSCCRADGSEFVVQGPDG